MPEYVMLVASAKIPPGKDFLCHPNTRPPPTIKTLPKKNINKTMLSRFPSLAF